jgi:hypothetical protein
MFRTVPLSIIRSYSLYTQQWYMSYRFVDAFKQLLESCLQTCMTYTIAECTVNNPWWWTEGLSETCRISFQNKFEKWLNLICFIIRKFVTMHGHMSRCTVTCHDARSHVTMHCHMSRCTVTCHDARSHERKIRNVTYFVPISTDISSKMYRRPWNL